MQRIRWNKQRVLIAIGILFALYMLFSSSYTEYKVAIKIPNIKPKVVWEYVADFNNMQSLNPTILNFKIIAETHPSHNSWHYSVKYTERLSHWPYWMNVATGHYQIQSPSYHDLNLNKHLIESQHETCFFGGLYCLHSKGVFAFNESANDTIVEETIYYQCPPFMKSVCKNEVQFQRDAILKKLSDEFGQK